MAYSERRHCGWQNSTSAEQNDFAALLIRRIRRRCPRKHGALSFGVRLFFLFAASLCLALIPEVLLFKQ